MSNSFTNLVGDFRQVRLAEERKKFGMNIVHDLYYYYLKEYHTIPRDIEDLIQGIYFLVA